MVVCIALWVVIVNVDVLDGVVAVEERAIIGSGQQIIKPEMIASHITIMYVVTLQKQL